MAESVETRLRVRGFAARATAAWGQSSDGSAHGCAETPGRAETRMAPDGGARRANNTLYRGAQVTPAVRVGIGHDTHRLTAGGPLRLGGVEIAHHQHLVGHSDADALLHAVTDALLGAAGLPDIGELFPDTDAENKGRDSAEMLALALVRVRQAGFRPMNVDCIVFAQEPKLSPYKEPIRQRLAELLGLEPQAVGVKAKTGERVGPVGREEAIVAECVILLENTPE